MKGKVSRLKPGLLKFILGYEAREIGPLNVHDLCGLAAVAAGMLKGERDELLLEVVDRLFQGQADLEAGLTCFHPIDG